MTAQQKQEQEQEHSAPSEPPADAGASGTDDEYERLEHELDELSRQRWGHGLRPDELVLLNAMAGRGAVLPAIRNAVLSRNARPTGIAS